MALRLVNRDMENTCKKFEILLPWSVVNFSILTEQWEKKLFLLLSVNIVMLLVNQPNKQTKNNVRCITYAFFIKIRINAAPFENILYVSHQILFPQRRAK